MPNVLAADNSKALAKSTDNKRISGPSRYHTAVEISKHGWKDRSADTVIIARGDSFPDALAGAPLAKELNAPILLTGESLHNTTKSEIKRLGAKKVIILGGKTAVSDKVVRELRALGIKNVERVAGGGRYETAVAVANKMKSKPNTAILAYGLDFPDALAIAPYAAKKGYPILLTETTKLSNATKAYLNKAKNIKNIIIIGGTKVINSNVEKELKKKYNVTRINGSHRYDTAAKILNKFYPNPKKAYVANGTRFPDALTGAVLASKEDVPLLLVKTYEIPSATRNIVNQKNIETFTFLGGESVVSDYIIRQLLKKEPPMSYVISTLRNSPLKSSADGTQFYYVDTEYPEVIRVFVDGNNVTKIMWNPMAYNTRNVSKQELVELLGADYAEEVYQYNKKVRSEIESAVRAAANAVYGSGTSKANQLYSQIINTLSQHKTFTF